MPYACYIAKHPAYRLKVTGDAELLDAIHDFFKSVKLVKQCRRVYGRTQWHTAREDVNLVEGVKRDEHRRKTELLIHRGYFAYLVLYLYDLKQKHGIKYDTNVNYRGEIALTPKWAGILRDYQIDAYNKVTKLKGGIVQLNTGSGKAMPLDTPILTEHGFRPMGELKVGDRVYSQDGTLTEVIGVYPQDDVRPCYELTTQDNQSVRSDYSHLWRVKIYDNWYTLTTEQLLHGNVAFREISIPKFKSEDTVAIKSIVQVEDTKTQCIAVDHPSHLYVCKDYIVTHNSEIFTAIVDSYLERYPQSNVLITVPKNAIMDEITARFERYELNGYLDGESPRVRIINPMGYGRSNQYHDKDLDKWMATVGLLICDEVHRAGATSYTKTFRKCLNVEYSYGFSATASTKRLDDASQFRSFPYEAQMRIGLTGPASVFKFAKDMGKELDYIAVHGNFGKPDKRDGQDYGRIVNTLCRRPAFLNAVKKIVNMWGNKVFYLPIPFIQAGEQIYSYLSAHGIKSLHWTGGYRCQPEFITNLDMVKEAIDSGEYRVLISTSTSNEGVDIAGLTAALLVCGRDHKAIVQCAGRAGRRGIPTVINLYNEENPILLNQARQRNTWIRLNYNTEPKKVAI